MPAFIALSCAARRVIDILADLNRNDRITVLVSLHQVEYALRYCPRTIALRSGEVVYDGPSSELTPALLKSIYGAQDEDLFVSSLEPVGLMEAQTTLATMPGTRSGLARNGLAARRVWASGEAGAGGIGQTLYESIRSFQYAETAAQVIIVVATVIALV